MAAMEQQKDTIMGWGLVGLILGLFSSPELQNLLIQAIVIILFPSLGWTVLYFLKREITYRFPPKEPKLLQNKNKEVVQ